MPMLKKGRRVKLPDKTYEVVRELGQGGSGIVYEARSQDRVFALKVFFPFYQLPLLQASTTEAATTIADSLDLQKREYHFLSRLSHPNIVKVHAAGELALTVVEQRQIPVRGVTSLPVLITDLVVGEPFGDAVRRGMTARTFAFVLVRLARALEYLHAERQYMHADLKSANILVRANDSEPVLIDFALCKNLNFQEVMRDERTKLLGDWDLFPHKELPTEHRLKTFKEADGTREELFNLAFPWLDLFQFGKLLKATRTAYSALLDPSETQYVDELSAQLTDWSVVTKWGVRELRPRLERLGAEHFAAFGVPELVAPTSAERTVTLPPGIGVPLTKQMERIVDSRSFRRLSQINQLSLLSLVYPGCDYKRSVHALYAYDLARQFAVHLYGSPTFRILFDARTVQQLLATVLLHDINHFPFLHIFQESRLISLDRLAILDLFCNGEATGEREAKEPSIYELLDGFGIEPDRFKRLVFSQHHLQQPPQLEVDQTISSLINSGVDLDKLSYLVLDAHFSGVKYGAGIDLQTLLKAAVLARDTRRDERPLHLAFEDRALQAVENVVMTRFWHFRSLYWHHTNRAVMTMILHVVRRLYGEYGRNIEDYLLDTLWKNDVEVVRYLDAKYTAQTGAPSILKGLIEDRRKLYKRIYTVQAGSGDTREDDLYARLQALGYPEEVRFRRALGIRIVEILGRDLGVKRVTENDVLLDVPRRKMDSGGSVYIHSSAGNLVPLTDISAPIRAIDTNYEILTKRTRVFLNPAVVTLTREQRTKYRREIQRGILDALEVARIETEVK